MRESENIVETLWFLENGEYSERKQYIKDYHSDKGVFLNGYTFIKEIYVVTVWKTTDIGKHPQYKGDPLSKVVPYTASKEQMIAILDNQDWIYW